jgi:hypothetical protein
MPPEIWTTFSVLEAIMTRKPMKVNWHKLVGQKGQKWLHQDQNPIKTSLLHNLLSSLLTEFEQASDCLVIVIATRVRALQFTYEYIDCSFRDKSIKVAFFNIMSPASTSSSDEDGLRISSCLSRRNDTLSLLGTIICCHPTHSFIFHACARMSTS